MKEKRFFNSSERNTLYTAAEGISPISGEPLPDNFHADHINPYSAGGPTDVINGQAVTPEENLRKGTGTAERLRESSSYIPPWPSSVLLRQWQADAFERVKFHTSDRFLCVAAPGAGKTIFASRVIHHYLLTGQAERVVIVSPTQNLIIQWAEEASRFGIEVNPESDEELIYNSRGESLSREYFGISLTYQAMAMSGRSGVQRTKCGQRKTIVVLDEIHHAARQEQSWGTSLQYAFSESVFILVLSGTPFRTDGKPIPFINYSEDGRCLPDFNYGYGAALRDGVVRPIFFPTVEGQMSWIRNGKIFENKEFKDETLDDQQQSDCLRAALQSENWAKPVLKQAVEKLNELRAGGHADAGGLIVAMDHKHAEQIAKWMRSFTYSKPLIVTNQVEDVHAKLEKFRDSPDPWIIAVKMVSEGTDIKRLRVCYYLTNIVSELFFRQVAGRISRVVNGITFQPAYMYIPADPRINDFAQNLINERNDSIISDYDESYDDNDQRDWVEKEKSDFQVIDGRSRDGAVIFNGQVFTVEELIVADRFRVDRGLTWMNREQAADLLRRCPEMRPGPIAAEKVDDDKTVPLYRKKRQARRDKAVDAMEKTLINLFYSNLKEDDRYRFFHNDLNRASGCQNKKKASLEQIEKRNALVREAFELSLSGVKAPWMS